MVILNYFIKVLVEMSFAQKLAYFVVETKLFGATKTPKVRRRIDDSRENLILWRKNLKKSVRLSS